jgi:predicted PurR-regulated permease PerM
VTKKLVWLGIAVMTTLLALVILWQFIIPVIYLLISLAIAAAVSPIVKRWARHGLVTRLALIFLFVLVLGVFVFLAVVGGGALIREIRHFANTVAIQDAWMLPKWLQGGSIQSLLATRLPPPSKLFAALTGDQGQLVLPAILDFTRGMAGFLSATLIIIFLSLYWSLNQVHFERLWLSLLPPVQRNRARNIWHTIQVDLGVYIRSQIVQALLAGLLLGLGCWALGSPYPMLLAVAGALACLVPMVGVGIAIMLSLLIGLLTSVQLSLLTALYTLVILIALEVWVKPRLFNHRQYNPILTVIILIVLARAFGLIGVIAAPPLSAAIQILWDRLVTHRVVSGSAPQISDLKARQTQLWELIQVMDAPPPLVISSMERLTALMEKAELFLQEDQEDQQILSQVEINPP